MLPRIEHSMVTPILPCRTNLPAKLQCYRSWALPWTHRRGLQRHTAAAALTLLASHGHLLPESLLTVAQPALASFASLPGLCFDPECQRAMDRAFLAAVGIPLVVLVAAVAYLTRPPPQNRLDSGELFEDSVTGTVFEAPKGTQPERDHLGELAFRAVSYTPWPLEQGAVGERLRIDVGQPGKTQPRTYVFSKVLPQPSQLITVQLPRPLGIVFEEDARKKRAVVAGFVPGGNAEQLVRRFRFDPGLAARAPREGDVLRACTCTNIVYKSGALFFGAQKPERCIVVYGADGQKWPAVMAALQKGLVSDGEVTLVLERPLEEQHWGQLQRPGMQREQQQQQQQQGRKL